jgi:predicted nucleic acid-binding protein
VIILDTNVLSEVVRPEPTTAVARWMSGQPTERLFTTAMTQAEILYGLEVMPSGRRRAALKTLFERMFDTLFADRVLPFDSDAAPRFAMILARRRQVGRPIAHLDAQIAAIAGSRGAVIATRNVKDFEHCQVDLLNPWMG